MIKSYTNQKNQKPRPARPMTLTLSCPIALPNNIKKSVQDQIFDIIKTTPFKFLSIPLSAYPKDVDDETTNRFKYDKPVNIGFVRGYDEKTNTIRVVVVEKFAQFVENFINPAIEIVYTDSWHGELQRINRFNIIALGPQSYGYGPEDEKEDKPTKTSKAPKQNATSVVPKSATVVEAPSQPIIPSKGINLDEITPEDDDDEVIIEKAPKDVDVEKQVDEAIEQYEKTSESDISEDTEMTVETEEITPATEVAERKVEAIEDAEVEQEGTPEEVRYIEPSNIHHDDGAVGVTIGDIMKEQNN